MAEINPQQLLEVAPITVPLVEPKEPRVMTQWWRPWLTTVTELIRELQRSVFGVTMVHTQQTDVSLSPNTSDTSPVSFPGVQLSDRVTVTFAIDLNGVGVFAYVAQPDQITMLYSNLSGGNKTLTAPFTVHIRAVSHNFS